MGMGEDREPEGAPGAVSSEPGLADRLRAATRRLHDEAERSGFVAELLGGRAGRRGYALYLRNLLPVYRRLEEGLERHRREPATRSMAKPEVYRSAALEADLLAIEGPDWSDRLPLLPSADRYARRIAQASSGDGARLVGHAYTRFLGDLSGGRILQRLLARSLSLEPGALAFYEYPGVHDLDAFRRAYRAAVDAAADFADALDLVDEARLAFRLGIDLSREVQRNAG